MDSHETAHSFLTQDELSRYKDEYQSDKEFRTLEQFADGMGLTKCQVCENYHLNIAYEPTVLVHGEPQRICLDCQDHKDSEDESFALKLAEIYARQMLILSDEAQIVRQDVLVLLDATRYDKIENLTDDLIAKRDKRVSTNDCDGEAMRLLTREYDRIVTHLWKCKEIADKTNYLLTSDGFTQETINKVFRETRLYINYNHEGQFLKIYGLQKSIKDDLYWRA